MEKKRGRKKKTMSLEGSVIYHTFLKHLVHFSRLNLEKKARKNKTIIILIFDLLLLWIIAPILVFFHISTSKVKTKWLPHLQTNLIIFMGLNIWSELN